MSGSSFSPQKPIAGDNLATVSDVYRDKVENAKKENNKVSRLRSDGNESEEVSMVADLSMN